MISRTFIYFPLLFHPCEVQLTTGEMAANKEFDSDACEKTWTCSWRQNMGKFSLEKYKLSIETVDDVLTISVIPWNPTEKTFTEDSDQDPLKIIDLFRCAHFPVKNGAKRPHIAAFDSNMEA